MSDNDKAPGWSVRGLEFRSGMRWCIYDRRRLICWTEQDADADRIVEAVNGLTEAQRERDELRAELAALRGAANTVWRVGSVKTPDGVELWSVYDGDRLVMAAEDEARARLVAAAPGCLRVADEARAELDTLRAIRERAAVEQAPASTLTALVQAAERLNATVARHEELLGIAPEPDEIAKLRKVALAVADWLAEEWAQPREDGRREATESANSAVRSALGCQLGQGTVATLCALAGGAR